MSETLPPPPAAPQPAHPQPAGPQPPYPQAAPPRAGNNGLSIAAFVLSLLGGVLLGLGLGIAGLVQARKRNQKRGLAIAAIAISCAWALLIGIGAAIAIAQSPDRDADGALTSGGTAAVTELRAGDCLNGAREGMVTDVSVVPCAQPHDAEVVGVHTMTGAAFPGAAAVEQAATEECGRLLDDYAGEKADAVDLLFLQPVAESWDRDKTITCLATQPAKGTGSIRQ
ncbi:septum formation family protein [Spirilliplanes yamanashiensis]|uniref:Septum formation-related domain-containing protein n=1 Tax=Spirilliplanes yamanashiensis TaxID=42233 RepID=A0A8J4DKS5_9ACTN|nr:septum formation family protein [Spirilliplanes yamanashiensis]MDP9817540.1 hypothetical protein [Spirilliplanes yamanashiensis]GIJ04350.1 hypothetical protein Sya03_37020 [Spirilliplanes yamanashiensis]